MLDDPEERSLEGWEPVVGKDGSLAHLIDLAFDYRGNVTLVKRDGTEVVGYLSNRDSTVAEPFVHLFDEREAGPSTVLYSEIQGIRFTGKDTAAGKSYTAYVKRRDQAKREAAEASHGPE